MQYNETTQNINNVILLEAYTDGLNKVFELAQDRDTEEEFYVALATMEHDDIRNLAMLVLGHAKEDMWEDFNDDEDCFESCFNLDELQLFAENIYIIKRTLDRQSANNNDLPGPLETFASAAAEMTDQDYATTKGHYAAHKAASDAIKNDKNYRKTHNPFAQKR